MVYLTAALSQMKKIAREGRVQLSPICRLSQISEKPGFLSQAKILLSQAKIFAQLGENLAQLGQKTGFFGNLTKSAKWSKLKPGCEGVFIICLGHIDIYETGECSSSVKIFRCQSVLLPSRQFLYSTYFWLKNYPLELQKNFILRFNPLSKKLVLMFITD